MRARIRERTEDALLRYAVILARCGEELVLCRHRERTTW